MPALLKFKIFFSDLSPIYLPLQRATSQKAVSDALKIAEQLKGGSWEVTRGGFPNHCPVVRDQAAVSSLLQNKVKLGN